MRTKVEDDARFGPDDCAAVVIASFACPVCLATAELIVMAGSPGHRHGKSVCRHCDAVSCVSLSDEQAYQLWTLQRGNTYVHFAPEHW